ncbi:putative uncharacterized protein [Blautia hydrogenotrophica CAG:147]|uniref:hypothetical protein n=1 Tax=Blautia hydrogenotrophica TaxID=53443 RepID=UPI00033A9768|nr:hypothetical protein [Blautia hydrogenotrophica]CCX60140.1 putative uncharacterized protein [Blautia hydrogenotrophica CAG:147]
MNDLIYEAIFGIWCDSGGKPEDREEIYCAVESISCLFNASREEQVSIETKILAAVCASEKNAFIDGLRVGVGLVSGKLFYEGMPDIIGKIC